MWKKKTLSKTRALPRQLALIAGALILALICHTAQAGAVARIDRRADDSSTAQAAAAAGGGDAPSTGGSSGGSLGGGAIAGIVCGAVLVVGAAALLVYRRSTANQSRPVHGGRVAKVVAMRGAGAMNLQGNMAVLAEEDDFQIGTQQGVISYTNSDVEKPARTARPISWYKAREAGVSPLHMHAITARTRNSDDYPIEESNTVELYSPGGGLQTPMVGNVAPTQTDGVQIVIDGASAASTRPLPDPSARRSLSLQKPLETPLEGPNNDYLGAAATGAAAGGAGHITDVEWDSEDEEAPAGSVVRTMTPMTSEIVDSSVHVHPRLFILTPGRDGIGALSQPENWSRTTFLLRLLCEGAASDYSETHLTEEHGMAIREPNAFLRHAARYVAQTADALIARDDSAFEQAEAFASSSDAGEYLEALADTLRAWYSDQLVALEEAVAEGHDVDQELLEALRAQKDDPATSAKAELSRFLAKYDSNRWNGGLRARKIDGNVRWLCASCASRS